MFLYDDVLYTARLILTAYFIHSMYWLTFLFHIRALSGSNIVRNTAYTYTEFSLIFSVSPNEYNFFPHPLQFTIHKHTLIL
jgi:hypothetical protein